MCRYGIQLSFSLNWDVPVGVFFGSRLHNPLYKATMSIQRFKDIRRFLHFDDKRTRAYRLKRNHMAAFRYIWGLFLVNCRQKFILSDCVTVDEQLVPFRGKTQLLQYLQSKHTKVIQVIQKVQFLKINEKINKNAKGHMSQTCFMRNNSNMKILQLFVLKILKNNNRVNSKMHWFYLGSFLNPLVEECRYW